MQDWRQCASLIAAVPRGFAEADVLEIIAQSSLEVSTSPLDDGITRCAP